MMQRIDRPLYLMHTDPHLRAVIARLPGEHHQVLEREDWPALRRILRRAPSAAVAVVDPCGPDGDLSEELHALLRDFPSATVLAALPGTNAAAETVRTLLSSGVADVVDLLRDDSPAAMMRILRLARNRAVRRLLSRALPRGLPSRAQGMVTVAAEVVLSGGLAGEFARALGISERTVPRWCMRADLPPPRRLLAWLRILLAADLLDDPGRSAESAARAAGYAGVSSLKTALRQFLDTSPGELRACGAFETVASAFARELRELREHARTEGKPEAAWLN